MMTKAQKDKLVSLYYDIADKAYFYYDMDSFKRDRKSVV